MKRVAEAIEKMKNESTEELLKTLDWKLQQSEQLYEETLVELKRRGVDVSKQLQEVR